MDAFFQTTLDTIFIPAIKVFFSLYFVWVPIILGEIFINKWLHFIRMKAVDKDGSTLLEIRLPREITKSPLAMEIFFSAIWQKSPINFIDGYWKGKVRPWFSLEIVSLEGQVHFYIWTQPKFKDLIEAQLYAQYPTIEIAEVEDYAKRVPFDKEKFVYFGGGMKLEKPDPYPIRTYEDFGLDKASEKEEFKTDPLSSIIETLGALQKGEQFWMQILIQAHRKIGITDGFLRTRPDWKKKCEEEIKNIMKKATDKDSKVVRLTKTQEEAISAIERSMHKFPFDTAIRMVYVADKSTGKIGKRIPAFLSMFRAFGANHDYFNNITIGRGSGVEYPWQDFRGKTTTFMERAFLNSYKKREYFHGLAKHFPVKPFILTNEELATIYHFPGEVARTPTLARIESRKSQAPSNLPI